MGGNREMFVVNPVPASACGAVDRFPWRALSNHDFRGDAPDGRIHMPVDVGDAVRFGAAVEYPLETVSNLYQSSDGRIWIGAGYAGLIEFDDRGFRRYTTAHGLSSDVPSAIAEDSGGNVWYGTFANGATRIARNGFLSYAQSDGLADLRILSIFGDQAGELCVVADHSRFHWFDGVRFNCIRPHLPKHPEPAWYHVPLQDHTGEWWVPSRDGLYRFPRVSRIEQLARTRPTALYTTRDGLAGDDTFSLFEDKHGDVWIGTSSDTRVRLTRWERATNSFHRYTEADGLPAFHTPSAFGEDTEGNLWIGFWQGGLARVLEGRLNFLSAADGAPDQEIRTIFRDHAGRLWIASNGSGLSRAEIRLDDTPRFVTYTTANGLASNNVRCITEDRWGRIYVGAGRGVTSLDPETDRIKHFTTAEGLVNAYVNAAFRDRNDRLWFGTLQGISQFNPEQDLPEIPLGS